MPLYEERLSSWQVTWLIVRRSLLPPLPAFDAAPAGMRLPPMQRSGSKDAWWIEMNTPFALILIGVTCHTQPDATRLAVRHHGAVLAIGARPRLRLSAALTAEQPQGLIQAQRICPVSRERSCFLPDPAPPPSAIGPCCPRAGWAEYTQSGALPEPYEYPRARTQERRPPIRPPPIALLRAMPAVCPWASGTRASYVESLTANPPYPPGTSRKYVNVYAITLRYSPALARYTAFR